MLPISGKNVGSRKLPLCYDCERPISYWARRMRLEDGRIFHRSCWGKFKFFLFSLDLLSPPPQLQHLNQRDRPLNPITNYEIAIVEQESRGLILVWDFGWASRRYRNVRIETDALPHGAIHRLGDISIAPRVPRQSSKNEPIVLLPEWEINGPLNHF
jgi:hypothetical protein